MGTNLALLDMLWMLVSGGLLGQRGAIFPALKAIGLSDGATRRAWLAFRRGAWRMPDLLRVWREPIERLPGWQVHSHEGYRVVSVDVTAFWRPSLKGCPSKHYHPAARRALPAVMVGIVAQVGELGGQRLASPRAVERAHRRDGSEKGLWRTLLRHVKGTLSEDEIAGVDAGVKIRDLQAADIARYVVRLSTHFTARRNTPAPYSGEGRHPLYGQRIRPLPRKFKDKTIPATPPDCQETWEPEGRTLTAQVWENLVWPDVKPNTRPFQIGG